MGKIETELSERRAVSILGKLDNSVSEVEEKLEDNEGDLPDHIVSRLEEEKVMAENDFREFAQDVKEQIDGGVWERLAIANRDLLE